jgi:hypothetical protein
MDATNLNYSDQLKNLFSSFNMMDPEIQKKCVNKKGKGE